MPHRAAVSLNFPITISREGRDCANKEVELAAISVDAAKKLKSLISPSPIVMANMAPLSTGSKLCWLLQNWSNEWRKASSRFVSFVMVPISVKVEMENA